MLDRVVESVDDATKRSGQTVYPYQSVWLAHWKRTSCGAAGETSNPDASRRKELDNVTENDYLTMGLEDSSRPVEKLGMTTTFKTGVEIKILRSKSIENLCSLIKNGQDTNDMRALKSEFDRKGVGCKSVTSCYTLVKLQNCGHDVEKMRICTPNGLLITKPTDADTVMENDMFRSRGGVSKINGNLSSEFHSISPFLGHGKQQLILQPPNSLIDHRVEENIRDFKNVNFNMWNESSAETATMAMDSSKKNLHSGSNSTPSTKAVNLDSNILPDINLEPAPLPVVANLSENTHENSSKSLSLEMNKLLKHVEQPKPKPKFNLNDPPNADTGNNWVKRLKLSYSDPSSLETKSLKLASSSQPTLEKPHGKKSLLLYKNGNFSKKDEVSALWLSHAWIQRLVHNRRGVTEAKPETNKSSELTMEKLQKEQLPSVAAMALMAKALTCFQPCELQKRGRFTIWNTKSF